MRTIQSLSALMLFIFATTFFDLFLLMAARPQPWAAVFLAAMVFIQGYMIWFFATRLRLDGQAAAAALPGADRIHRALFLTAMVAISIVALVAVYAILRNGGGVPWRLIR